jgi:XXXCH domain-containing protein
MITVPGKGDADYERYITAVHRLNDSISGADLDTIKAAVDEIGRICKECHGKYK